MTKHIPNAITLLNLCFGACALVNVFVGDVPAVAGWLLAAAVADYADGAAARLLGHSSPIGKELDSFADMVSFGVVPGAMLYALLAQHFHGEEGAMSAFRWAAVPAFVLTAFSGLRLAKFNIDTRQSQDFIGLATPACTAFVLGLLLTRHYDYGGWGWLAGHPVMVYACVAVLSGLLVAEVPMFSLKPKGFSWRGNEIKITFAAVSLLLLALMGAAALSPIVVVYVLLNVGLYALRQRA